ncbi:MAG: glycosyltransferase family 39 protein [candidate division WOR-3 bacterium]
MPTTGQRVSLFGALTVAAALRLVFLSLPATSIETKAVAAIPDAAEYLTLAQNLVRHQTFSRSEQEPYRPEVLRTPGYPLFLALFFVVFPKPLLPILAAQLILSLLLVLVTYRFCLELTGDNRTSLVAAYLVALSPNLAFVSTKVVTETLFTLMLAVTLILFNRHRTVSRVQGIVASGVCCGLLALVRPIALYFPLLLAAVLFFDRSVRQYRHACSCSEQTGRPADVGLPRLLSPLLLLAGTALVVLPLFVRNARLTGRWVLSTTAEHNLVLYNAATVLALDQNVSLAEARELMKLEAEAPSFAPLDTLNMARYWQRLTPVAWRHILRKPWLALRVQLLGFVSTLASPISLRPLAVHSGTDPGQEPNVAQRALTALARGQLVEAARLVWQSRLARLGWFGVTTFTAALIFQLGVLILVLLLLVRHLFLHTRFSFPLAHDTMLLLFLTILYFALPTGALGEARMRAPIEPVLAVLAAAATRTLDSIVKGTGKSRV